MSHLHQLEEIQAQQEDEKDVEEVYEYVGEVITPGIFIVKRIIQNQGEPHRRPVIRRGALLRPHREEESPGIPESVYLVVYNYVVIPDEAVV